MLVNGEKDLKKLTLVAHLLLPEKYLFLWPSAAPHKQWTVAER